MNRVYRAVQLIRRIILKGKFGHRGKHIQDVRRQAMEGLQQFYPTRPGRTKTNRVLKASWIRYWLGQAAFIRNAFRTRGGHLFAEDLNLCYIRNPKAASTALSYAILSASYPGLGNGAMTPEQINFLTDANLCRQLSHSERNAVFFTVVRNPFARIVSVYRQFFQRSGPFIYDDYLFGILDRNHSFKEFLNIVQLIPDKLKDQHLKPQHGFLTFYERRGVAVKILKLEESEALGQFLSAYGLALRTLNRSDAYDYQTYFDEDAVQLVYEVYEKDIRRFGYEAEAERLRIAVRKEA